MVSGVCEVASRERRGIVCYLLNVLARYLNFWPRAHSESFFIFFFTVYAIEATVHAPTFEGVYGEIFKVLKPGGVVSLHSAYISRHPFTQSILFPLPLQRSLSLTPVRRLRMGHDRRLRPDQPDPQRNRSSHRDWRWNCRDEEFR